MQVNNIFRKVKEKFPLKTDQLTLLYFLSLMIGFLSGLAAALLKNAIHYTHLLLTEGFHSQALRFISLAFPLVGLLLTVLFVRYVIKDNINHGISRVLYAISRKKSSLDAHNTWSSLVASTLTIASGGSVGAEAPIVLTGSSIGSVIGSYFKLNYRSVTLLVGCGAAGAVSGIFKAPIAGILFTLEILMLDLTISSVVPLLISSVTAAIVATYLMGNKVLFSFTVADEFNISNIPWYLLLGVLSGFISLYFSKMTLLLENGFGKISNLYFRLLTGGIVLSVLVFFFPPFYGEGYDTIMALLVGNSRSVMENSVFAGYFSQFGMVMLFMFLMIIFKVVASSATNGAGGVGGIFAPTLFLGGINGFFVASILKRFAGVDLPDNRFVLVGMAGMMAGVMHAPLTAIFLIAEITGGYSLLIPLILTSTVAYITVRSFEKHSIYHIQLAEKGELITHDKDKAVMVVMDWRKDIETDLCTVRSSATLGDLVKVISASNRNIFPVVDDYNILEGVVTLDDVRNIMFRNELYDSVSVRDLLKIPPSYIDKKENLETVMNTFRRTGAWNLPVLDNGYYVGFISKSRIYGTYRDMLTEISEE